MKLKKHRGDSPRRLTKALGSAAPWALALAGFAGGSCAIEGDEACGKNQVFVEGKGLLDYAVCRCDDSKGYVFDVAKGYGCRRCPEGQTAEGGKCSGEGSDADAGAGDEPTGVGEPCGSEDDCAGYDATYCAAGACALENCATGESMCTAATTCCDFSHLLSGFSLCVPDEHLEGGNCPMTGTKVEQ